MKNNYVLIIILKQYLATEATDEFTFQAEVEQMDTPLVYVVVHGVGSET